MRSWEKRVELENSAWRLRSFPLAFDERQYNRTEDSPVLHLLEQKTNMFILFSVVDLDLVSDFHSDFVLSNHNTFLFITKKRQTK